MPDYTMAARRYRLYAEELRCIAADDTGEATAAKLRSVADAYDQMAASMDAVIRSRDKLKEM